MISPCEGLSSVVARGEKTTDPGYEVEILIDTSTKRITHRVLKLYIARKVPLSMCSSLHPIMDLVIERNKEALTKHKSKNYVLAFLRDFDIATCMRDKYWDWELQ